MGSDEPWELWAPSLSSGDDGTPRRSRMSKRQRGTSNTATSKASTASNHRHLLAVIVAIIALLAWYLLRGAHGPSLHTALATLLAGDASAAYQQLISLEARKGLQQAEIAILKALAVAALPTGGSERRSVQAQLQRFEPSHGQASRLARAYGDGHSGLSRSREGARRRLSVLACSSARGWAVGLARRQHSSLWTV